MREIGYGGIFIGAMLTFFAYFVMPVSTSVGLSDAFNTRDVVNLALLQDRLLVFIGGCVLGLGGTVLVAVASLTPAVRENYVPAVIQQEPPPVSQSATSRAIAGFIVLILTVAFLAYQGFNAIRGPQLSTSVQSGSEVNFDTMTTDLTNTR